jgi:hypothetical protein
VLNGALSIMSAAAKQGDDNSVAILALIVGGVVGIVGPVISAAVLAWRSTREVSAARQRQDANNAAAATNLETQLTAERERLQLGPITISSSHLITGIPHPAA